jgi:cell division protein FtsX
VIYINNVTFLAVCVVICLCSAVGFFCGGWGYINALIKMYEQDMQGKHAVGNILAHLHYVVSFVLPFYI